MGTLQGLINRVEPRIYLVRDGDEGKRTWLEQGLNVPFEEVADPWELVGRFASEIDGSVLPDPDILHTVNVATTIGGLRNAVVCQPDLADRLSGEFGLPVVDDLRGRFTSNMEANRWQYHELWPQCSHRLVMGIDPAHVLADSRDLAIALQAMPIWLDPNVDAERALLERIMDDTPDCSPYLGWFAQDIAGEFSGTELCSEHGVSVLAADWFHNGTVWAGTRPQGRSVLR